MFYGGKRCVAAVIVAIAVLAAAVPLTADASSAYEAKDGSSSVYFRTSDPLSSDEIGRLYTEDGKRTFAQYAVNVMGIIAAAQDVTVENLELEMACGDSVDGGRHRSFRSDSFEADISCTVVPAGAIFGDPEDWNVDLLRYFGNNSLAAGEKITIKGHLECSLSAGTSEDYTANGNGDMILSGSTETDEVRIVLDSAQVSLVGASGTRTVECDMSYREIRNTVADYDFGDTDPEDADASAMVFIEYDFEDSYWSEDYSYDGEVSGSHDDYMFNDEYYHRYRDVYLPDDEFTGATVVSADIACGTTGCFGTGSGFLFSSVADSSLQSEDALREFLASVGTVSDDYSDAWDLYDGLTTPPAYSSKRRLMVIGSIGVLLSVGALAILFYLSRRR